MNKTGYSVAIVESSLELTAKEKVMYKDTSICKKIDDLLDMDNEVVIAPFGYVLLQIHNEKSDDKEYEQLVIIDKNGERYITGSSSFKESFFGIFEEMAECGEDYEIKVYKKESNNYKGKFFYICSIIG